MFSGDLAQALAEPPVAKDGFPIEVERLSADAPALELGPAHAGADTFDDQVPFELGDRTDDDNDGAAQRAAGVDLLAEADELDAQTIELVEHLEEVFD